MIVCFCLNRKQLSVVVQQYKLIQLNLHAFDHKPSQLVRSVTNRKKVKKRRSVFFSFVDLSAQSYVVVKSYYILLSKWWFQRWFFFFFLVTSLHLAVKFRRNRYPDLEETRTKKATHKLLVYRYTSTHFARYDIQEIRSLYALCVLCVNFDFGQQSVRVRDW